MFKNLIIGVVLVAFALPTWSQEVVDSGEISSSWIDLLRATDDEIDRQHYDEQRDELSAFINKLANDFSDTKSMHVSLERMYYKVHRKFLKQYAPYSSFGDVLTTGRYDCLSGTALYAILLESVNVPFKIVETNYHIFIHVETDNGQVLIESTDPLNGYIDQEERVNEHLAAVKAENSVVKSGQIAFDYDIYGSLNLMQFVGLHYYNASVKAFNQNEIKKAIELIAFGYELNRSVRLRDYGLFLAQSLMDEDALDIVDKQTQLLKLKPILRTVSKPLASR